MPHLRLHEQFLRFEQVSDSVIALVVIFEAPQRSDVEELHLAFSSHHTITVDFPLHTDIKHLVQA